MNARRLYPWALATTLPAGVGILDPFYKQITLLHIPEVRDFLTITFFAGVTIAPVGIPFALGVALFGRNLSVARRLTLFVAAGLAAFGLWWAYQQLKGFASWHDA